MTLYKNRYRIESTRLSHWDYSSPAWYFVTICTQDRRTHFGDIVDGSIRLSPIGKIVRDEWRKTAGIRPNVDLDEFVVMPNHIHGIVVIKPLVDGGTPRVETPRRGVSTTPRLQKPSLGSIIGQFKIACTRRIRAAGSRDFAWQTRFHDRIIRGDRALMAIREYIANNPAKWALDTENPANTR
jgi:putative transposase